MIKYIYAENNENNINEGSINLNVISIGDGEDEKKAVFKLDKNKFNFCQNLLSKFRRMIDCPSASSINNINYILNSNKIIYIMNIEIVNGSTQVKCIPKKKRNKIDKLKLISSSNNNNQNTIKKNNDYLIFNNSYDYEENEFSNNKLFYYLEKDEDLIRQNLFLGKKKYYKVFD